MRLHAGADMSGEGVYSSRVYVLPGPEQGFLDMVDKGAMFCKYRLMDFLEELHNAAGHLLSTPVPALSMTTYTHRLILRGDFDK